MMSKEKRSQAYQELYNAVEHVSKLNPGQKELTDASARVVKAIMNYTKGKKSVRHDKNGQERFNNALDALSIIDKYVPGCKGYVDSQVDRIRAVRKVQPGHKDYVDLSAFGEDRARDAKLQRIAKEAEKKREKPKAAMKV